MKFAALITLLTWGAFPAPAASCENWRNSSCPRPPSPAPSRCPREPSLLPAGPPLRDLPAFCRVELV